MSRGMKVAAAVALAIAAVVVAQRIRLALLTDEDRIRRLLTRIEEGFNAGEAGTVAGELAEDFTAEEDGLGRNEVRLFLFEFFRSSLDPSGQPRFRVEAPAAEAEIALGEGEPKTAAATVTARFLGRENRGAAWQPVATIRFTARLVRQQGEWKISRARREKIEGRWPF
jgi:SnoaL-like protein